MKAALSEPARAFITGKVFVCCKAASLPVETLERDTLRRDLCLCLTFRGEPSALCPACARLLELWGSGRRASPDRP